MALGLLLLALSWVEVTMAHHLVRVRQNAAEELRLQSVWAARDIWKQVDEWMADGSADTGLKWSGNQVQPDPDGTWRSARNVDDELVPRGHSECKDGTGISVCWRVDSVSYHQPVPPAKGPPQQTLAITVGVWCDGEPNLSGPPGQRGCERFRVETRRYEYRSLIRYVRHYDTDRMPYHGADGEPPPRWPHELLGSLSTQGQEQARIEFPDGHKFVADYHTNERSVLFCGTPAIDPDASIETDRPADPYLSPDVQSTGWEPRSGCTASIPGGKDVDDTVGQISVASGLAFQQDAAASTSPKCSAPDTPRLAALSSGAGNEWQERPSNPAEHRMWLFDEYLPPGAAWLAEAKAVAEATGITADTHVVTHKPGQTYTSHDHLYSEISSEYLPLATRQAFKDAGVSEEQRDNARTVAVINLDTLTDGAVIWSSADITEVTGNLPAGTATDHFTATVAAASDVVLIAKEVVGSEMTAGAANDYSALALMAGCNIQVRVLDNPAHDNIHIKGVAAMAPAGIVHARWATACPIHDGRQGHCGYSATDPPPELKWSGSIASRYKVTFGIQARDGETTTGYKEVNEFPNGWERTRFPWWPRLIGGTWKPA